MPPRSAPLLAALGILPFRKSPPPFGLGGTLTDLLRLPEKHGPAQSPFTNIPQYIAGDACFCTPPTR